MKLYLLCSCYQIDRVVYVDVYTLWLIDISLSLYFVPLL